MHLILPGGKRGKCHKECNAEVGADVCYVGKDRGEGVLKCGKTLVQAERGKHMTASNLL